MDLHVFPIPISPPASLPIPSLNNTKVQLDLNDVYRTFHPKTINFTFFSSAHGTFSRIDHIHKSSRDKLKKKIEVIPVIFSDHNAERLDLNYREKKKKTIKNSNIWRLNNMLLNNHEIKEEINTHSSILVDSGGVYGCYSPWDCKELDKLSDFYFISLHCLYSNLILFNRLV